MSFISSRISYAISTFGIRLNRLVCHLFFIKDDCIPRQEHGIDWVIDLLFYLLDVMGVSEILDIIHNGLKPKRKLNPEELTLARGIIGEDCDLGIVYLTEKTRPLKADLYYAYVSFNTINSIEQLSKAILIHELVHIWQYQRYGSVYIYRALKAQNTKAGYDYGGYAGLLDKLQSEDGLLSFNFEQQASIVEDYYRISVNPFTDLSILKIYEHFVYHLVYKKSRFVA